MSGYSNFIDTVDSVIAPSAVEVDATEVPASHLEQIAKTGLFGWTVPEEHGGHPEPVEHVGGALEYLFGACPSTGLIVSQHLSIVQRACKAATPPLLALLPRLVSGELIGGAAYAHVRSWPRRKSVTANRVDGGYLFDGEIPWVSGWGLLNLATTGAIDEDRGRVVIALADLAPTIDASPVRLAAIQGARTVSARLNKLFIPDERVLEAADVADWNAKDGRGPKLGSFSGGLLGPVGLARAALDDARRWQPDEPSLIKLADEVEQAGAELTPGLAGRARLCELAIRATTAALIARGGSGLLVDDIAQVRARAALFLQVRALSPELRTAQLERWVR